MTRPTPSGCARVAVAAAVARESGMELDARPARGAGRPAGWFDVLDALQARREVAR